MVEAFKSSDNRYVKQRLEMVADDSPEIAEKVYGTEEEIKKEERNARKVGGAEKNESSYGRTRSRGSKS